VSLLKNINFALNFFASRLNMYVEVEPKWFVGGTIAEARNVLVAYALREGFDYVWFNDADIAIISPDGLTKLLYHAVVKGRKIVSGVYWSRFVDERIGKPRVEVYRWVGDGFSPIATWEPDNTLLEADAVGLGLCVISTEIFKKLKKPWFTWYEIDLDKILAGENDVKKCIKGFGEDLNFFYRVKFELGLNPPVLVDTSVKGKHIGFHAVIGDNRGNVKFENTPP